MADMVPGARICVTVDSIFSEGIVVSFVEKNGQEYRGALLTHTEGEACKICSTSRSFLANPLTLLHDHPYSKLKNYAKRLANAIPSDILTDWNSLHMKKNMGGNGLTIQTPLSSRQSSPSSIELPVESTHEKSATVEVTVDDPVSFPNVTNDQLFGAQMVGRFRRRAKSRAKFNIKATLDEMNNLKGLSGRLDAKVSQRRSAVSLEPARHKRHRGRKEQSAGLQSISSSHSTTDQSMPTNYSTACLGVSSNHSSVGTPNAATVTGDSVTVIDVSTSSNESYYSPALPTPSPSTPQSLSVANLKYPQLRNFSIDLHKVPTVRKCAMPKGNTPKDESQAPTFEIATSLCPDIDSEEDIGPPYVVIDLTESDDDDVLM